MSYREGSHPYTLSMQFNDVILNDDDSCYRVFRKERYGTPDANLLVSGEREDIVDGEVIHHFNDDDYPLDVVVCVGLKSAQFLKVESTLMPYVESSIMLNAAYDYCYEEIQ